jgi:hypothetical protein
MQKFSMAVMRLPLGYIARNRDRGPADLVGQAVYLSLWKVIGDFVDFRHEVHCLLPNDQVFEVLRHNLWVLGNGHCYHLWVLGTEYWVLNSSAVPNVHHISILHDVVFAFQAQRAFGAGVGLGTGLQQLVPADRLRPDEMFF